MGIGQTMVTALFFVLLMIMFLNAINTLNQADKELYTSIAYKTATDLAQSLMVEILTKRYDQNVSSTNPPTANSPSMFSSSLGPDAGESISQPDVSPFKSIAAFNDVDDYNKYVRITDSTNGLAPFKDSVNVYYVQMTNPPTYYSSKWWTKRVEVWVTQRDYMSDSSTFTQTRTYNWVKLYRIVGFNSW